MIFLEVIIALVFVYATGAVFCSFVLEIIAARTGSRAKLLKEVLTKILGTQDAQKLLSHPRISVMYERKDRPPSYLSSSLFAKALLDGLRAPATWLSTLSLEETQQGIKSIKHLPLRDSLASLYAESGEDLALLEEKIGGWFDEVMARVTGWYRRKCQYFLLVIAFVTVITFNLDTFTMVKGFWTNAAVRSSLVSQAELLSSKPEDNRTFDDVSGVLKELPFGWNEQKEAQHSLSNWFTRILGWLVSTLAIGLGSPFWFDLLKKLVNLRATGIRIGSGKNDGASV